MAFPTGMLVNGQKYTTAGGVTYIYQIATDAWTIYTASISMTGIQGVAGVGLQGITGLPGTTGLRGITGIVGAAGYQYLTGIQGVTGLRGITGLQGITGIINITGMRGLTGLQGITGVGQQGVKSTTGIQGVTGSNAPWALSDITSTVSQYGWSGSPTMSVWQFKQGLFVLISFYVSGTGSGTTAGLTGLPYQSAANPTGGPLYAGWSYPMISIDNVANPIAYAQVGSGGTQISFGRGMSSNWSNGTPRTCQGVVWYYSAT